MSVKKMKKFAFGAVILFLCLLCGCSAAPSEQDTQDTTTQEQKQTITADALQQAFERVYESSGASLSKLDAQVSAELTALRTAASSDALEWPNDYEQQYRDWREAVVAKADARIKEEYRQLILERGIYVGRDPPA